MLIYLGIGTDVSTGRRPIDIKSASVIVHLPIYFSNIWPDRRRLTS